MTPDHGFTVAQLIELGARRLQPGPGLPEPRREARWLLAAAWGVSESRLLTGPSTVVPEAVVRQFEGWLTRRAAGEPAHHLTGVCPFAGREFEVDEHVLIPRPETEWLVEAALEAPVVHDATVLDVGVGSGCVAVTLACERPGWRVFAVDRSVSALGVARRNVSRHGVAVRLLAGDLAAAVAGPFDLVTANLPYIPSAVVDQLSVEVRHEPRQALDGGPSGTGLIVQLLDQLHDRLRSGAVVVLEVGEDQAGEVERAGRRAGLEPWRRTTDFGGVERIVGLRRP